MYRNKYGSGRVFFKIRECLYTVARIKFCAPHFFRVHNKKHGTGAQNFMRATVYIANVQYGTSTSLHPESNFPIQQQIGLEMAAFNIEIHVLQNSS